MTTIAPDERESGLPKWAQTLIADLRWQIAAQTRLAEEARLATNPNDTNTYLYGRRSSGAIGLPNRSEVFFRLGDDPFEDAISVEIAEDPTRLVVHSPRALLIRPSVSNSFSVCLDRS
jgi:hypothetical protein